MKGIGPLAMITQMIGMTYGMNNRPHREPHYFDYSGIPSEEQKRKGAERKARKKAKKGK